MKFKRFGKLISSGVRYFLTNYIKSHKSRDAELLDDDLFEMSLWNQNGSIVLGDLEFKKDALQEMELPIKVAYGRIDHIEINFRMHYLKPELTIKIKGVYILLVPNVNENGEYIFSAEPSSTTIEKNTEAYHQNQNILNSSTASGRSRLASTSAVSGTVPSR